MVISNLSQQKHGLCSHKESYEPSAGSVRASLTHVLPQLGQIPDCAVDVLCVVGDVALACSALMVAQALHVKAGGSTHKHNTANGSVLSTAPHKYVVTHQPS